MKLSLQNLVLPNIPTRTSAWMFVGLLLSALLAYWATPHLTEVNNPPILEDRVPRKFGDWKELPSPYVQVALSTGTQTSTDQPYDQTVMRTYVNSAGQQVMLALAWGKRQRQEVKIHRPDLCYVAQGYQVSQLTPVNFSADPRLPVGVIGKHMVAMSSHGGEAVSYWIRIGSLYSESATESRLHIFKQGVAGLVPDGILVRASQRIRADAEAEAILPTLDRFLSDLYEASPTEVQALMIRK